MEEKKEMPRIGEVGGRIALLEQLVASLRAANDRLKDLVISKDLEIYDLRKSLNGQS